MGYVMSLDQGTTSCRCILFDHGGTVCSMEQEEFTQYYPVPGWVEHDPLEIWNCQLRVARRALERIGAKALDIAAIGITNQRETTVVWNKRTGQPVYNAIVWQCRRTSEYIDTLVERGLSDVIRDKTGLIPDAYFSGSKIRWILEHVEGARELARRDELLFGTIDTWLIWNLTGGKVHATDYTNASRTMLFNIHELCWDKELMELMQIPESMLPEVRDSSCVYGYTEAEIFGSPVPVGGAAGDQQSALFGQCCFAEGDAKNTYGTGCFLLMNTGEKVIRSKNGLLSTIAVGLNGCVSYALEGSIFIGGAVVQWLRDEVRLIDGSADSQYYAEKAGDTDGVYLVPAFIGLGAPYWNQYSRGCIVGITRGTTKAKIIRAALEAIAYQTADVCRAMEQDSGIKLRELKVDGGASRNDFLLQFQSDILNADVYRAACVETTALGAAYLAGLAVGYWKDQKDIVNHWSAGVRCRPSMEKKKRESCLAGWKDAVSCALSWGDMQKKKTL